MLPRNVARGFIPFRAFSSLTLPLLSIPKYSCTSQKEMKRYLPTIVNEINAQVKILSTPSQLEQAFKKQGWEIKRTKMPFYLGKNFELKLDLPRQGQETSRTSMLIQLQKNFQKFAISLLSTIKSPQDLSRRGQPSPNQEQTQARDTNQVIICIRYKDKDSNLHPLTMVYRTHVTQTYEIKDVYFVNDYLLLRDRIQNGGNLNEYSPKLQSLSDELFEAVHDFLEQECKIDDKLLVLFGQYCYECENEFFLRWLQNFRTMLLMN